MSSNQPKRIYKYQSFSKWSLQNICHDQLHFSDPTSFNDPFDCRPTIKSDSDNDTLKNILKSLIVRRVKAETLSSLNNAKLKGEKSEAYAERVATQTAQNEIANIEYHATNPDYEGTVDENVNILLSFEIEREILQRYNKGICCFSTSFANPLMWSHYAEQHNGICVGYSLQRKPIPVIKKVKYGGNRIITTSLIEKAVVQNDENSSELLDSKVLLTKAPQWKYEHEWRLLGNRGIQDSPLALTDITFGLRCPSAIVHAIISALEQRQSKVKFFEMIEVHGEFKLRRREVDVYEMKAYLPRTAMSGEEMFGPVIENKTDQTLTILSNKEQ